MNGPEGEGGSPMKNQGYDKDGVYKIIQKCLSNIKELLNR